MGQVRNKPQRDETIDFIQQHLMQLKTMAEGERATMLAYLIDMAYIEACDIQRGTRNKKGEDVKLSA